MTKETGVEKTLALIKPDAIRNGDTANILQKIELKGFTIVTRSRIQLTPERAGEFYAEHKGKPFYDNLVNFMSSGPLMALVLAKSDAILAWRSLMGPTNSLKAREEAPKSLRALYGTDGTCNATHGSDSVASACREIRFFFPKLVQDPLPDSTGAKDFVARELQPTLVKCLTTLCKVKPTANKLEAITWVANWLLDNNPNKPRPLAEAEAGLLEGEEEEDEYPVSEADAGEEGVDKMEEELAATRLQSHFRGYQTRKTMKAKNSAAPVVVQQVETTAEDEQAAAVKVQSLYRGHKARKTVKEKKAAQA
uniref:Nucleoside diphosphate kinase n=1 Tax=Pyramimonas obovata TaxID=1411642 RepID=A0A7S0R1P3_9CHLO|mmetsp:Transcript_23662/g.51645  ORF Transcript_23662/g.51645 Transcript_23662/m.51645 type:complete len:308 (+) Transcript_23662:331-1254(+)|eukprot:CAMPEP_0118933436 /NCGR_PEP_ID=MMETSP1169-20130426/11986_1 /TAXON_ID=36882 /ORGANISM="Pyramimonas obovata, Strain CCMP722" /LENGTH=307 /DNA_ID=CAMNT_0006876193 /DNA_START=306 /DNA_END=1229 /DNA_ORIENTATION=+